MSPYRAWRVRFRANGQRRSVTYHEADGWTRIKVERERRDLAVLGRKGLLARNEDALQQQQDPAPLFTDVAAEWWEMRKHRLAQSTREDYAWRLNNHIGPAFGSRRVSEIGVADIDGYVTTKLKESAQREQALKAGRPMRDQDGRVLRPLSPQTINKTLDTLAGVLELAEERGWVDQNPMNVNRRQRRLRPRKPRRTYLDSADKIAATINAAAAIDAEKGRGNCGSAVMCAFIFGGFRIGELVDLRWKDIDLANGRISISHSKTDAGIRDVNILPVL